MSGDPANAGAARIVLSTTDGALRLSGQGSLGPNGFRFRGEATAASEAELPALSNLLNIIGRRSGARSVITIG
jgi:general secretion pathway protein N